VLDIIFITGKHQKRKKGRIRKDLGIVEERLDIEEKIG
jgi:hypothetical protein